MSQPSMTAPALSLRSLAVQAGVSLGVVLLLLALAFRSAGARGAVAVMPRGDLHWPRLTPLLDASAAIQAHVAAVAVAFLVGLVLMAGVKGSRVHRTLGWGWVAAMATAAVASLFIRQLNPGGFSFLHLISGWTLIALPMAVVAIRRRKVRLHARLMTGLFMGGLVIAGLTAFLPGRLMWRLFFG